jgi:hypothetical protein
MLMQENPTQLHKEHTGDKTLDAASKWDEKTMKEEPPMNLPLCPREEIAQVPTPGDIILPQQPNEEQDIPPTTPPELEPLHKDTQTPPSSLTEKDQPQVPTQNEEVTT